MEEKEDNKGGRWLLIDDGMFLVVLPNNDIKPHGHYKEGDTDVEVAGADCPCKPKVISGGNGMAYDKPIIVHNCFEDEKKIEDALQMLGISH